jgi:uncharacterized protein
MVIFSLSRSNETMKNKLILAVIPILFSLVACTHSTKEQSPTEVTNKVNIGYEQSINTWHKGREESLKKEDGWLALVGLFWLKEGRNTFGSSDKNDIVFPNNKLAAQAGAFILNHDQVLLEVADNTDVTIDGAVVKQTVVYNSEMEQAPEMKQGSLSWYVIKRGDKYGIRLRDAESEARKKFKGVERYPVASNWKLEAQLELNPFPKQIAITNVLGQTSQENSPGALVFTVAGQQYRLDVLEEGDELFLIFADKTNGTETYGAGRYLYAAKPGVDGKTILDFNKATNPPCAFTSFATCPLPPKQNFLAIKIPAGEKAYEGVH